MKSRVAAARPRGEVVRQFIQCTAVVAALLTPLSAAAQTVQTTTAHIVEWDLPAIADASPGAMVVDTSGDDNNRLWFVTRLGAQRVIRLDPATSLMTGSAQWKSWQLADDSFTTGGTKKLRASRDRRFIFVRTAASIQRIDTQNCDTANPQTCQRIEWFDQVGSQNVSDMSVDDLNNVFTTATLIADPTMPPTSSDLAAAYVQRLTPGSVPANGVNASTTVSRWKVGGGAGFCADLGRTTTSFPCVSGIAVHPSNRNLIYYSEPEGGGGVGAIGELNVSISTNNVRRWPLSVLPPDADGTVVQQPRQLNIDSYGNVWVVTGSGHLVSLNPSTNRLRKHAIPNAVLSDPFGVAPDDDVVGYTDTAQSKVGMLFPKGPTVFFKPTPETATKATPTIGVMGERAIVASGSVPPQGHVVKAEITDKSDGVFVDVFVGATGGNTSESPLGITPNKGKAQGTFFYAVGFPSKSTADRVGFVRMPMPGTSSGSTTTSTSSGSTATSTVRHPRDDDDAEDGWDHNSHPAGWHTSAANDDDADGLENSFDLPTARENVQVVDGAPAIAGGQSADFPVTTSPTSLALIATATAGDPLAQIGVEIYDALGMLVATSAPSLGVAVATVPLPAASTYKVRIRNYGMTSITHTPRLIVREPWLP